MRFGLMHYWKDTFAWAWAFVDETIALHYHRQVITMGWGGTAMAQKESSLGRRLLELLLQQGDSHVSGEELSRLLGVTRAAVWKEMEKLRAEGYELESATRRGYRLKAIPDTMNAELVNHWLTTPRQSGLTVLEEVDSTITHAQRMILEGEAHHGDVVIADRQTKGAGRMGRSFESPGGVGIYLSYILQPDCDPQQLSLLTSYAGLAVCKAITQLTSLQPAIKWPNDIILQRKKVCGILTKLVTDAENGCISHAVVGIGINVGQTGFDGELDQKAVSIRQAGAEVPRARLAAAVIENLDQIFVTEHWLHHPCNSHIKQLRDLSCTVGAEVTILSPSSEERGRAVDIAQDGGLVVEINGKLRTITSGEVSVRGMLGYV